MIPSIIEHKYRFDYPLASSDIMLTLIPTAVENLHPNQWQHQGQQKNTVKNGRPKLSNITATTNATNPNTRLKRRCFRENAPHVVGKRVTFRGINTFTIHEDKKQHGGLMHFARLYNRSEDNDEPVLERKFTPTMHQETKQSIAYSNYINHLISPHVALSSEASSPRDSFSTLLLHQNRSSEISSAYSLYDSYKMQSVRKAIDREVGRGRLIMRSDRDMNEILFQQELVETLMSYNARWLGVGLSVVLGERGMGWEMANKHVLEKIVKERILSDPTIRRRYTGGKVKIPSGKYEAKLRECIHHHALIKMLTLVTYLDMAKGASILNDDPCLFDKEHDIKSSNAILASICRICFARKELIVHHMSTLGISVSHVQNPLDEYEYYIRNLSIDLKDGVRLAKMVEILTGFSVLSEMRVPATSRAKKMYNVGVVLSTLQMAGVENINDVTAAHIVDAHQPRILQLLWSIIVHFQILKLDCSIIQEETKGAEAWIKNRRSGSTYEYQGLNAVKFKEVNGSSSYECTKMMLLAWCRTICSFYDIPVKDFNDSFSDGKVLCLLISFYHPKLLSSKDILQTVTDIQSTLKRGVNVDDQLVKMAIQNEHLNLSLALSRMQELGGLPKLFSSRDILLPPDERSILLCVSLLFSRLTQTNREIIAAREIQQWWHGSLNQRKRDAAILLLIQWRRYKTNYFRNQRLKFLSSVQVIESFYRTYESKFKELARHSTAARKRIDSVVRIQSILRMALASKCIIPHRAARLIQSKCRMLTAQKKVHLMKMETSCVTIQKNWRTKQIQFAYKYIVRGIKEIQSLWRAYSCRSRYEITRNQFITAQSLIRRYLVLVRLRNVVAHKLCTRSFLCRYLRWKSNPNYYSSVERDEARVQALFSLVESRGIIDIDALRLNSAIYIQSAYRGHIVRRDIKTMTTASIKIQQNIRRYQSQLAFGFDLMDIIKTQSIARRYIALVAKARKHKHSITIQRIWRGFHAKLSYGFCLIYITKVQSIGRRFIARQCFIKQRAARQICRSWRARCRHRNLCIGVIKIQSISRSYIQRSSHIKQRNAIVTIQSFTRKLLKKRSLIHSTKAVTKIQSLFRAYRCRRCFKAHKLHAIKIQAFLRRIFASRAFKKIQLNVITKQEQFFSIRSRRAALTIQYFFRNRSQFRFHRYATIVQQYWRGYSDRSEYLSTITKILLLQRFARQFIAQNAYANLTIGNMAKSASSELNSKLFVQSLLSPTRRGDGTILDVKNTRESSDQKRDALGNVENLAGDKFEYSSVTIDENKHSQLAHNSLHDEDISRNTAINSSMISETSFVYECDHIATNVESEHCDCTTHENRLQTSSQASPQKEAVPVTSSKQAIGSNDRVSRTTSFGEENMISYWAQEEMDVEEKSDAKFPFEASIVPVTNSGAEDNLSKSPYTHVPKDNDTSLSSILVKRASKRQKSPHKDVSMELDSSSVSNSHAEYLQHASRCNNSPRDGVVMRSVGVMTRSKANMLKSLETAKPRASENTVRDQLHSPSRSRSLSSSLDLGYTIKALEIIGKSCLISEVKDAIDTLEGTTQKSKDCCKHFARVKGHISLCFLIAMCNRSTSHIELIHNILQILTNVGKYRSSAAKLATVEVVEMVVYICQMYRDKSKLLSLSCSLLENILTNGDKNIIVTYSTQEQKMRLYGILSLCKKRTSIEDSNAKHDLMMSISRLENIIRKMKQL